MNQDEPPGPRAGLGERVGQAQSRRNRGKATGGARSPPSEALGVGFRIGIEFVVAVVVGLGLGWAIDRGLGTRPWGMIVLFFLGVAAGMVNVYRTLSGMGMAVGYRGSGADGPGANATRDRWDDDDEA